MAAAAFAWRIRPRSSRSQVLTNRGICPFRRVISRTASPLARYEYDALDPPELTVSSRPLGRIVTVGGS